MDEKTIYDLQLNEVITIEQTTTGFTEVRKVPGGWIYTTVNYHKQNRISMSSPLDGYAQSSVFVPFKEQEQAPTHFAPISGGR